MPTDPAHDHHHDHDHDLRHHGDAEVRDTGLLDLAVNVYAGPRPGWLDDALRAGLAEASAYPDPSRAEAAVAARHGRPTGEVLAVAGAAEAFSLVARLRAWRRPVVVHPQFTEPHAALEQAGCTVTPAVLPRPFLLDPATAADVVPDDADLVMVGNPTNPTGALHPAAAIRALLRPGRLVVVDEAFMDAVPGEPETLTGESADHDRSGLVVLRSLTKHWSIPGVRAGYLLGPAAVVADLRRGQVPWSVSSPAAAAIVACCTAEARAESARRADELAEWRGHLEKALADLGVDHLASSTSFVLARVGPGVHAALRERDVAVRRADTFPGLDGSWVRIAVRPPETTALFTDHLRRVL